MALVVKVKVIVKALSVYVRIIVASISDENKTLHKVVEETR